jgi:hypothetical protein
MTNGTIYTGNSADGSDAKIAEGVYDYGNGQWGVMPPGDAMHSSPMKRSPIERAYNEVMDYIEKHNRTLQEEYELIQQRKSNLSKRLRDFVELMIEIEKHNPSPDPSNPPVPHE